MNERNDDGCAVFVCCHAPDGPMPECFARKSYRLLQCGAAVNGRSPKADIYDDGFDGHVSAYNEFLNEATGIYSVCVRPETTRGLKKVGFCHYRRTLDYRGPDFAGDELICSVKKIGATVLSQYRSCHSIDIFTRFVNELLKRGEKRLAFDLLGYFSISKTIYLANNFLMSAGDFSEYSKFAVKCVDILKSLHDRRAVDISGYSAYNRRYLSFLFERLTSFWISRRIRESPSSVVFRKLIKFNIENRVNSVD